MAKFARPKLPPPPTLNDVPNNLSQPENPGGIVDGRTLRATGRTTQFSTRITEELQHEIKLFSVKHKMKLNEFVEQAYEALKEKLEN